MKWTRIKLQSIRLKVHFAFVLWMFLPSFFLLLFGSPVFIVLFVHAIFQSILLIHSHFTFLIYLISLRCNSNIYSFNYLQSPYVLTFFFSATVYVHYFWHNLSFCFYCFAFFRSSTRALRTDWKETNNETTYRRMLRWLRYCLSLCANNELFQYFCELFLALLEVHIVCVWHVLIEYKWFKQNYTFYRTSFNIKFHGFPCIREASKWL